VTRQHDLAAAFVDLADSMVSGTEVFTFLHRLCCHAVDLLAVDAAGVMLADENDVLRAVAASNEDTHLLEIIALQHHEGVCLDVFRAGEVGQASTVDTLEQWPNFSKLAVDRGYGWCCGIPLRHAGEIIGAMNLFREKDARLDDDDVRLAQALADVATVGLLQRRETTHARKQAKQLQEALDSRVLIEQAKGVLAGRLNITPDEAFQVIRREARNNNRKLHDLAREIVHGDKDTVTRFARQRR
jgi:transcriptional regulator with GAF, ATPase, and Fis domain